jgi:uncharacterized lipoprotein YddW (UPF0748 family)
MRWVAPLSLLLTACLAPTAAQAGERLHSDAFSIADSASASATWSPIEGSEPVVSAPERTPDGEPAVAFRFDMSRLKERAYWDRAMALDLSRFGRIAFWAKVEGDRSAVGSCSLYFNSGNGWYATSFALPGEGWQRVVIDRASFNTEDTPQGWNAITGIRVSFWRGQPRQAVIYLGGLEATASDVVVVRNTRARREAAIYTSEMVRTLTRAGVQAGTVDDLDVEAGVLTGKHIAIYPLNPSPSDEEMEALEAFVRAGGRVLVCYSLSPRLAALVGVESLGRQASEYPGQFARMRSLPGMPPGMPDEAKQDSWNIEKVRPATRGARVVAEWMDASGMGTGYPAVVVSDTGAYISHVLLNDDPENKDRLLRALLGYLYPDIWEQMAQNALANLGPVTRWSSFSDADAGIRETAQAAGRLGEIEGELAQARQSYAEAQACVQAKRYPEGLEYAAQARLLLLEAYARCQPAREGEFRGVWCHSGYGVTGLTWDESIRRLYENGFNAIVVNAMRAGIADYQSELLPVRDRVAREGDQIALAVAAGRKYGVEVHVWKVNWNLSSAPEEFVDRMRAEGRLQQTRSGAETAWLCPSDPRNFQLERDSMLEVVRKYDVDGIHFDYIRYPDHDNCYCDGCRQRFEASNGLKVADWPGDVVEGGPHFSAYQEFRSANITRLVKAVSEEAHRIKPWIKVSAAVFSDWPQCREQVGQDWVAWVQQGYLDFLCPMDYSASDAGFRTWVQSQRDAVAARLPFYPGVGASAPGLPLGQVIDQIGIARAEGADGFIIFEYQGSVAADYIPSLGKGVSRGTTYLPHDAPVVEWRVRQDGKALEEGPATSDAPVEVEAALTLRGRFRRAPRRVWASVAVTDLAGRTVREIGGGTSDGPPVEGEVRLAKGLYRLEAWGEMALADGKRQPFVVRGPFVRVE